MEDNDEIADQDFVETYKSKQDLYKVMTHYGKYSCKVPMSPRKYCAPVGVPPP